MEEAGVAFSPKKSKSNVYCSVFGCSSRARRNPELRFHTFPDFKKNFVKIVNKNGSEEMVDRRKRWEYVLKMGKKVTSNMLVCSLHFKKEDYMIPGNYYVFFTKIIKINKGKIFFVRKVSII